MEFEKLYKYYVNKVITELNKFRYNKTKYNGLVDSFQKKEWTKEGIDGVRQIVAFPLPNYTIKEEASLLIFEQFVCYMMTRFPDLRLVLFTTLEAKEHFREYKFDKLNFNEAKRKIDRLITYNIHSLILAKILTIPASCVDKNYTVNIKDNLEDF